MSRPAKVGRFCLLRSVRDVLENIGKRAPVLLRLQSKHFRLASPGAIKCYVGSSSVTSNVTSVFRGKLRVVTPLLRIVLTLANPHFTRESYGKWRNRRNRRNTWGKLRLGAMRADVTQFKEA